MKTKQIIFFVFLIILGVFSPACNNDNLPDEGDAAVIALSLNGVDLRGGDLFAAESIITKIRIFVVRPGGYVETMKVFNSGEDSFNNPFRIETTTGAKDVYVVANEPADISNALNGATTLGDLQNILTVNNTSISADTPLPMFGFTKDVNITAAGAQTTVKLVRMVAKITMKIKKGDQANTDIVLHKISLYRGPVKSMLFESNTTPTGQTYWNIDSYGIDGNVEVTPSGVDAWTSATPLYLYENPGAKMDTTNRATYIVLDATYNGVKTTYHAYVNDDNSNATDHKYSVKRNHHYNITATINNIGEFDGLIMTTDVLPWTYIGSDVLYDRVYTITPFPIWGSHIYEVNNQTDAASFEFVLENPYEANWVAHLSDPINFKFTSNSNGTLGSYIIRIQPNNAQDNTEKTTEFYITVNGNEIPLINGSTAVGQGNRIIIKQPALP